MSKPNMGIDGINGLNYSAGYIYEDFLSDLQYPRAAKIYREMADNDPTIGAILYAAKQLIRRVPWTVKPYDTSKVSKDAAEFLEQCMHDMETSWADVIAEALTCFTYGWSYHEINYKQRTGPMEKNPTKHSQFKDGRIGWRSIPTRSQHTLHEWVFDEYGQLLAMKQLSPPDYKVRQISYDKALLFRTEKTYGNPEGKSLLRNAYRSWYFKKRIEEIEGIGIERDLAGLPVLKVPEATNVWDQNDPQAALVRQQALTLVSSIRRDAQEGVVLPDGWDLELMSTGGTRTFDTNAIINRYDNRIAMTLLSDIVMLGSGNSGSFALADVKKSLLAASLEAHVQSIADEFNNRAVTKLFEYNNFPGLVGLPKIVPGQVETPNVKDLAFLLRASGLDVKRDRKLMTFIRQIASIPEISDEEYEEWYQQPEEEEVVPGADGDHLPKVDGTDGGSDPQRINQIDSMSEVSDGTYAGGGR